jgi:beta-glucanase (GH16 family)
MRRISPSVDSSCSECVDSSRRQLLGGLTAGLGWASGAAYGASDALIAPVPIRGKGYALVQDWDFGAKVTDDRRLRDAFFTRYIYNDGKLDYLNDEWTRYRDNSNHVFENGALSLVARVQGPFRAGNIESGMLRSKWSGTFGYIEGRIKVPRGPGMWPALWLNPEDKKWPPEIDIVEIVDNGKDSTSNSFHFLHGRDAEKAQVFSSKLDYTHSYRTGIDYADGFHTFAVEWTSIGVRHFVDNVLVSDRAFAWRHDDGADAGTAHILLNLGVGGKWPGPPRSIEQFPAKLEVAYLRVWQKPPRDTTI